MQDADLFAFLAIFRSLLHVFPKRLEDSEIDPLARSYFTAFRRVTVAQIQAGADVWMQRGKFFPKPAEWLESIPRKSAAGVALSPLTPVEVAEHLDAERRSYEGDPCSCRACERAGVTHRFTRYVPESDELGIDAKGLIGERVVVRGHWAHGDELARFYVVRDKFWTDYRALLKRMTMPDAKPEPEAEIEPAEVA